MPRLRMLPSAQTDLVHLLEHVTGRPATFGLPCDLWARCGKNVATSPACQVPSAARAPNFARM